MDRVEPFDGQSLSQISAELPFGFLIPTGGLTGILKWF
jgi:hypothetical protein